MLCRTMYLLRLGSWKKGGEVAWIYFLNYLKIVPGILVIKVLGILKMALFVLWRLWIHLKLSGINLIFDSPEEKIRGYR